VEVGRVLAERYEIRRPLAEGAMATVWVAFDKTNEVEVAIKTISMDAAGWRAEVRDRFMKEAQLLARGRHEHLVGVRDVGETEDGYLYLVLDLLEGETLADHLSSKTKLDWHAAATLTVGITRGVAALHRAGIVHRDLKPANIVLRQTSTGVIPTIIDLGIGKASALVGDPLLCATLTATGQVLGTPEYMSYEQALGQTDIDARADVWAIGVMLYEMIAGSRPFEAPNTNAVLAAIRRGDIRSLVEVAPEVPPGIAQLIDTCLSTNRSERFADADALLAKLEAAMAAPTIVTKAPEKKSSEEPSLPLPSTAARKVSPEKRSLLLPGVVMIAVGGGFGFFLFYSANSGMPVATENPVPVKASVAPTASTLHVAPNGAADPSANAAPQSGPPSHTTSPTATTKPAGSTRNRPPVSRVDEAGF